MKHFRRILSLTLALVMTFGMLVTVSSAADPSFTDVAGHWAWTNGQIPYLVSKNVLNGYAQPDGTYKFQPDGQVTRAEFIKMLDETFGLTALGSIAYSDMSASDWFYPYFQKAAAQGYILNYGANANPNGKITREEAISLLVRYLGLDPAEKAPSSTFTDYNSISAVYRDYVLEAIYAQLINGYDVGGGAYEFRPQNTLTRAEALTILYRAAGAIFNQSANSRDAMAPQSNSVYTKGGITVSGVYLNGRNIVSEGAGQSTINFQACRIDGSLRIRGGANVTLENCTVGEVVLEGGASVSLLGTTKVTNVTADQRAVVNVYSGTSVDTFVVNEGADGLSVTGNGSIGDLFIFAPRVNCAIFPATYVIGDKITATLAGNPYTGRSDEQASFAMNPLMTSDGAYYYINVKPLITGKVYAYFTNNDVAPSTAEFDSYYMSSNFNTQFSADSGKFTTYQTYSADTVSGYNYVVLQLQQNERKYSPVVIPNTVNTTNGFSAIPYVSAANTLTFRAAVSGTVYWYYTDNGTQLSVAEFLDGYDAKESALKGSNAVGTITSYSNTLKESYLKNYGYVAFMIRASSGAYCVPVVVAVGDNGFTEAPAVKTAGVITFKAKTSGELFYYFTDTKTLPDTDKFRSEYNAARYKSSITVRAGITDEFKYDTAKAANFPYMVIAIRDNSSNYLQPVILEVNVSTGFDVEPAVRSEDEIRFRTIADGKVRYYYTASRSAPSIEEFKRTYEDTNSNYCGSMNVREETYEYITYRLQYAAQRPYLAIMFTDSDGKEYAPVLVELDNSTDNGFTTAPYVSNDKVYFSTAKDGEVWLYYTTDSDPISAEDFYDEYRDTVSDYRDTVTAKAGKLTSFDISSTAYRRNRYIILAFLADDARGYDFYYPYVLDIESSEMETAGSGLKTYPDTEEESVSVRVQYDGRLYYYLTDDEEDLPTNTTFERMYRDATRFDSYTVEEDDFETIKTKGYYYCVICLEHNNRYLSPVIIDMRKGSTYTNGVDDRSNTNGSGFTSVGLNRDLTTVTFTPKVSGTVTLYIVPKGSTTMTEITSVECRADTAGSIDLPSGDLVALLYGGSAYYIQLTSGRDVYEATLVTRLN